MWSRLKDFPVVCQSDLQAGEPSNCGRAQRVQTLTLGLDALPQSTCTHSSLSITQDDRLVAGHRRSIDRDALRSLASRLPSLSLGM